MIIDKLFFSNDNEKFMANKKARIENSFKQIFYELKIPFKFEFRDEFYEEITLGVYKLNVRANSLQATIREVSKFIVEYLNDSSCYYDKSILEKGIVGLFYAGE